MTGDDSDRPAVTGAPIDGADARREAITGDDTSGEAETATSYPADGVSPDRGSSAPRDRG